MNRRDFLTRSATGGALLGLPIASVPAAAPLAGAEQPLTIVAMAKLARQVCPPENLRGRNTVQDYEALYWQLKDLCPDITVEKFTEIVKRHMPKVLQDEYGRPFRPCYIPVGFLRKACGYEPAFGRVVDFWHLSRICLEHYGRHDYPNMNMASFPGRPSAGTIPDYKYSLPNIFAWASAYGRESNVRLSS